MANINIEKLVIGFLTANQAPGFEVFGDMPKGERPEAFVLVDRSGGPRDHIVQDRAEILIEVYHKDSRVDASDEAYRIADIMPAMLNLEPVMKLDVTSVVKLDDLIGQYNRYQVYCDIFYRRGDFEGSIVYPVIPGGGSVTSVNGQTGDVELNAADVGADEAGSAEAAEAAAILAANGYTDEQIANLIAEGFGDEPSTLLNLDNKVAGLLGEYITGGTIGRMFYNRQGRHIRGHVALFGNAANDWGFDPFKAILIKDRDLPYIPRNFGEIAEVQYPITEVGNFGLVSSNNGVDVSIGGSCGSAFSTVGQFPTPQMIFFKAVDFTDGQLGNLVYDNNPVPLAGFNWNLIARFSYEAAYEEGYIDIDETYPQGAQDSAYDESVAIIISSGYQLPFTVEVIAGAIPDGLALSIQNDTELVLSGEPTDTGVFNFEVEITDTNGATNSKNFTVTINPYNPELEAGYLGTVSGNSLNINLVPSWESYYGFFSMNIFDFINANHSQPGQILKIRSGTMNQDFGEGVITVLVNEYMIFEGGYWRKYIYA